MDVSVFGTGYVGLVQAAALADVGHRVLCVDLDTHKINQLRQGVPPISEPGLSELLEDNIKEGRLPRLPAGHARSGAAIAAPTPARSAPAG
ncbi:MAG: hypothetical protein ACLGJA_23725, partial [Gammaproteobacteria bacterium]